MVYLSGVLDGFGGNEGGGLGDGDGLGQVVGAQDAETSVSSGVLDNVHLAVGVDVAVRSTNVAKSVAHLSTGLQGLGVSEAGLLSKLPNF